MIGYRVMTQDLMDRVRSAAERAAAGNVRAMAFLVMVTARLSIKNAPPPAITVTVAPTKRDKRGHFVKGSGRKRRRRGQKVASPAGTPPYTHGGRLPASIGYAADGSTAVIGTQYSRIGTGGEPHENEGEYKGDVYPLRAFMSPALAEVEPKFGPSFQGSIGSGGY